MIAKIKIAAYVVLVVLALWFWHEFRSSYSKIGQTVSNPATNNVPPPLVSPKSPGAAAKNQPSATNASSTNLASATGDTNTATTNAAVTNVAATTTDTNSTNAAIPAAPTPNLAATNAAPPAPTAGADVVTPNAEQGGKSVGYLAGFVVAMIGLGILIAYDLTQFLGGRAVEYLLGDEGEGMRDPEYERAEQTWVSGKPLEAIEMMREYLKKNPRAQYAALRIAEIYEKDLRNYVAASLEYEEVLKKRLPEERWGWAAIHLCNIYSRMGKQDKMKALLERIARDYPKTGAAKKARRNLGLPEPVEEEKAEETPAPEAKPPAEPEGYGQGQVFDLDEVIATPDEPPSAPPPAATPAPAAEEPPKPNLPPGFRKKK